MTAQKKKLTKFVLIIILALTVGLISYPRAVSKIPPVFNALNKLKINLGLDLQGGIHLEYKADVSQIESAKIDPAMQSLQDVIERRVNAFGVAEPTIYTTKSGTDRRLVVELAGVKDINQAKNLIKETPFLEFKKEGEPDKSKEIPQDLLDKMNVQQKQKAQDILKKVLAGGDFAQLAKENSEDPGSKDNGGEYDFVPKGSFVPEYETAIFDKGLKDGEVFSELVETQFGWHIIKRIEVRGEGDSQEFKSAHILIAKKANPAPQTSLVSTGLTGKNLKSASVAFQNQGVSEPEVSLNFDEEGTKIFAEITRDNIGKPLAIFMDGLPIVDTNGDGKIDNMDPPYAPIIQSEITNGSAVINGNLTIDEANNLAKRLNAGALPVPISLVNQESVDASLGDISLQKSLTAGLIGLVLVIAFMIGYYRFLGLVASLALLIYAGMMISIFKLSAFSPWQITLTLPGIAGFILSIGMAVDANILIFERTKEEVRRGRNILGAIDEGFKRAWTSIRDGNVSSIITAIILIEMGTGFVKGFAVTLVLGVLLSMFTAVVITRNLLKFVLGEWMADKLWLIGVNKKDVNISNKK